MKVMLKGCTRCGGDLMRAHADAQTETVTCLQCGYERDITPGYGRLRPARTLRLQRLADNTKLKEGVAA